MTHPSGSVPYVRMPPGVYHAMTKHVSTEQRFQEMERKVAAEMEELNKVSRLER
jgi:hypothetical protein